LGSSAHVHIPLERLRAWKAIDEFGATVLLEALNVLKEEKLLERQPVS
jgi:hypothetical protein